MARCLVRRVPAAELEPWSKADNYAPPTILELKRDGVTASIGVPGVTATIEISDLSPGKPYRMYFYTENHKGFGIPEWRVSMPGASFDFTTKGNSKFRTKHF